MSSGIVYLVQPAELLNTNKYKVGYSNKSNLDRCKSYKNGSRYIFVIECKNPDDVEREIKKLFNEKFKLIAGHEYFEGDDILIRYEFCKIAIANFNIVDNNSIINIGERGNGELLEDLIKEIKKVNEERKRLMKENKKKVQKLMNVFEIMKEENNKLKEENNKLKEENLQLKGMI
jgi:hypothetical protein